MFCMIPCSIETYRIVNRPYLDMLIFLSQNGICNGPNYFALVQYAPHSHTVICFLDNRWPLVKSPYTNLYPLWLLICIRHTVIWYIFQCESTTQIAKTIGTMSIRHRSDTTVSDRCVIDVDPMVFAIWAVDMNLCTFSVPGCFRGFHSHNITTKLSCKLHAGCLTQLFDIVLGPFLCPGRFKSMMDTYTECNTSTIGKSVSEDRWCKFALVQYINYYD